MEQQKRQYISPQLTVVSFVVERGFVASGAQNSPLMDFDLFSDESSPSNEAAGYSESNWDWGF
ncbi:MAG: hypothetical protein J6Y98_03740 [Bacteroidales bacterium]|nr:hypothetical protein [Bacteroidales bacterium]